MRYGVRLSPGSGPGADFGLKIKMQPIPIPTDACQSPNLQLFGIAVNPLRAVSPEWFDIGEHQGIYDRESAGGILLVLSGWQSGDVVWSVSPTLIPDYLQSSITPDPDYPQFATLNYWATPTSVWGSRAIPAVTFTVTATNGGVTPDPFRLIVTDPGS